MKSVRLVAFLLFALVVAGCDQVDGGRSDVAVIDLQAVIRALGGEEVLAQQINQANRQISHQLGDVKKGLQRQLQEEREKYEIIGDEAEAELEEKAAVANQRLQQTRRVAQQRASEFRTAVIEEFRDKVQPYASEIARERGAVLVVTAATSMLWFDAEVDITDEVIAAMRKAGLERTGKATSAADSTSQESTQSTEGSSGTGAEEDGSSS